MERGARKTRITGLAYIAMLPVLALLITFIPLKSNAIVELPFLENSPYKRVLAFGGFPDCVTACPVSLTTLRQTYLNYQRSSSKNDLGIVFVNIKRDMPEELASTYIKNFHHEFEAYSPKANDTKQLYTSLALEIFNTNEEIKTHQGLIYLFKLSNNHWRIERVFKYDVSEQTLLNYLTNHPV